MKRNEKKEAGQQFTVYCWIFRNWGVIHNPNFNRAGLYTGRFETKIHK